MELGRLAGLGARAGRRVGRAGGPVIYSYNNIDTYRLVEPKVAAETAEDEPLVNWKWLGIGMGGVVILIVVMFFLSRMFRGRQERNRRVLPAPSRCPVPASGRRLPAVPDPRR